MARIMARARKSAPEMRSTRIVPGTFPLLQPVGFCISSAAMKRLLALFFPLFANLVHLSAQPELHIELAAQNKFEVSWPAQSADYQLEQVTVLGPAASWS